MVPHLLPIPIGDVDRIRHGGRFLFADLADAWITGYFRTGFREAHHHEVWLRLHDTAVIELETDSLEEAQRLVDLLLSFRAHAEKNRPPGTVRLWGK